jgi:YHS domain-containing protein
MSIKRRSLVLAAAAVVAAAGGAGAWYATQAGPAPRGAVFAEGGLAIRGYDPVAYFTEGRPVAGRPEFEARHEGVAWRFASAEHKATFEADPARYEPRYGGYCAWAVSAKNEAYPIDPNAWKIVDGRLYLNFSKDVQAEWERDVPGHVGKADANWPGLEAKLAGG